ncbi:hypothetical protein ANN_04469 [Periplaneta americana]|uniref:Uncharacterized protein n=1 Tax=Periplaneta americana TaxID=6978 RepID=A0ABQ8TA63_PERAM|nr:hypothetical protein ANN_04469 [Periplaneta americana]
MAGLCEGGNEPPGSLKASKVFTMEVPLSREKMQMRTVSRFREELPQIANTGDVGQRAQFKMEMERPRGETPEQQMGTYLYHVGSSHRQEKPGQICNQMGRSLQERRGCAAVQGSKEHKSIEKSTKDLVTKCGQKAHNTQSR